MSFKGTAAEKVFFPSDPFIKLFFLFYIFAIQPIWYTCIFVHMAAVGLCSICIYH